MHYSYNGVIAPYTYNCPRAHYFRNIKRVYIEPKEREESDEEAAPSKRVIGIQQHELIKQYLLGEIDTYEYSTDVIEWVKDKQDKRIEQQRFYDIDMEALPGKPAEGDYISTRRDAAVLENGRLTQFDWKFANADYGSTKHYDESEFFIAMESAANPDIGEWKLIIHFPLLNYSLPSRTYDCRKAAALQQKFARRLSVIRNDKFFKAKPSRSACKFCDYRSEDTGGSGHCEFTVI